VRGESTKYAAACSFEAPLATSCTTSTSRTVSVTVRRRSRVPPSWSSDLAQPAPSREAAGELHRTGTLADELGRVLDVRRCDLLSLSEPTSKRVLRGEHGYTAGRFESTYGRRLLIEPEAERLTRLILLDDVCTEGSTLSACLDALHVINPGLEVVAATAGQMTVRAAVRRERDLVT